MHVSPLTLTPRSLPGHPLVTPRAEHPPGDPYLRFQLADGVMAILSMQQVQEVHTLPAHRLTPMPNLARCVLGLMNRRSQVIWVIDLAQLLDIASLSTNYQHYSIVIVRVGDLVLALAVSSIQGFFWLPATSIHPIQGQLSPTLKRYLQGCAIQEQEVLLVLDAEAILHSTALHTSP
ncbi:MAG: chemotaxis protein CheW [Leptolyngbyaceae cyanobacterium bins.302]|nr:chemotaxis protein CheW [Leptolyngbyaceae cyanobacterium bins.302]